MKFYYLLLFLLYKFVPNVTQNHSSAVVVEIRNTSSGCNSLLNGFANHTAMFTYCAIRSARPIRLCQECIQSYLLVRESYNDILKLEDEGGEACKDQLFNLDRLQVVFSAYAYVIQLWKRANCDSCYILENQCPTIKLLPAVQDILNISTNLSTCIQNNTNDTAMSEITPEEPKLCEICLDLYKKLNDKYNSLKQKQDVICMDIIDLVNNTRTDWSINLKCCWNRKKPEITFIITSGIITLLPVLLYTAAWTFTKKKQEKVLQQSRWSENSASTSVNADLEN